MNNAKKDFRLVFLVSLCLIAGIIAVYGQVSTFNFVGYDDQEYVFENNQVLNGLTIEGAIWAFTKFHSANWHPLTWFSHMLDCELYGLNPAGHHWTNVEFHIANTLLLFIILFKMTGTLWQSVFVAALFALHPLHVESVAWVSERKDVLSTFFGLLSIAAYYRYVKTSSAKYYTLVIALLCLGLMAKPMLVTIPFVMLLLDFWPLKRYQYQHDFPLTSLKAYREAIRRNHLIIIEKIPLFIPVIISCIVTFFAQKSEGAVKAIEVLPMKYRIENAIVSYVDYVLKTIWPHKLAVFYPHPGNSLSGWQIVGATLLIVTAILFALRALKEHPYVAVGLFWYLGTLIPVIGLMQVGDQAMADRYTYIPLVGIFIVIAWGGTDILKRWRYRKIYLSVFAMIILSALTARTFFQAHHWKNSVTLFENAIKVTENNYKAHNNLATALGPIDLDGAIFHYKEALRINPKYVVALTNLGIALCDKGNYDEAISYFTEVLKIDPQKTLAHMNLANVFFDQGKSEKAISIYREILKTAPEDADTHYNLACVLAFEGRINKAILHYKETIRINPRYSKAHYNLGDILLNQGKIHEACSHFAMAIQFKPDFVQAYNKLGFILFRQRKYSKAKVFFLKALQIDSNYSEARKSLDILNQTLSSSG